jgi:predicted nucleic acid-binding protein
VASIGVVVDACVLIKASVRDTFIRAYDANLYRLCWSDDILAEVERNLVEHGLTTFAQAQHLLGVFRRVLADAQTTGYDHLIGSMTNDAKDRHIVAAAVQAGAQRIVTFNVKHFSDDALARHGIDVASPDDFLLDLVAVDVQAMADIVAAQAAALRRPPLTAEQVLDNLARDGVPQFVNAIRERLRPTTSPRQ